MNTQSFIEQLAARGARVALADSETLSIAAPEHVLTPELVTELTARKPDLMRCLSRRCPFCRNHGTATASTIKDGLLYIDTICATCGELIETSIT